MKGRIPVTLERFPQPNAHFLLNIGWIDTVLAEAMTLNEKADFDAVIGQQLVQARAQGGVKAHEGDFSMS
jgi:hypothetical protein